MRKLLLSTVALASLTAGAVAADLPSRRLAPAPAYAPVPVFTWTGFYLGANAGYGFSDNSNFGFGGPLTAGATVVTPSTGGIFGVGSNNRDGFVGGGQIGYNYQVGQVVFGVEADIQYTDFGGRGNGNAFGTAVVGGNVAGVVPGAPGNVAFFNGGTRSDYFGTVRGRLGYAFDRTLIYATGGYAYRDVDNAAPFIAAPFFTTGAGIGVFANPKANSDGYAVGGGVEYAFTPNLTGKVEGLYVDFGKTSATGGVVGVTNRGVAIVSTGSGRHDDFAVVRAGINYKFNAF